MSLLDFSAGRVIDLLHAHVLFAATKLRRIDGDEKTLDAACLGVLYVLFRDLPVTVDVELEEERLVVGLSVDDIVE